MQLLGWPGRGRSLRRRGVSPPAGARGRAERGARPGGAGGRAARGGSAPCGVAGATLRSSPLRSTSAGAVSQTRDTLTSYHAPDWAQVARVALSIHGCRIIGIRPREAGNTPRGGSNRCERLSFDPGGPAAGVHGHGYVELGTEVFDADVL